MSNLNNPRRPHVFIPSPRQNAQQPAVLPRGPVPSDYTFRLEASPPNPFISQDASPQSPLSPQLSPLRRQPSPMTLPQRPRIQSASDHYLTTAPISFPEPQSSRSTSSSRLSLPSNHSVSSLASYVEDDYGLGSPEVCSPIHLYYPPNSSLGVRGCHGRFITQIVCIIFVRSSATLFHCKFHSLDAEEALSRFQAGQLKESDQEWHLLVTPEACDALGKVEVQRQSVIFEIIKSERDYVADLEAMEQVGVAHPSCPIPSQLNNKSTSRFSLINCNQRTHL